jgi:hypothetical protein
MPPESGQHTPWTNGGANAMREVKRARNCGRSCMTGSGLRLLTHQASHWPLNSHWRTVYLCLHEAFCRASEACRQTIYSQAPGQLCGARKSSSPTIRVMCEHLSTALGKPQRNERLDTGREAHMVIQFFRLPQGCLGRIDGNPPDTTRGTEDCLSCLP